MTLNFKLFIAALGLTFLSTAQTGPITATSTAEPVRGHCGTVAPPAEWDQWFNQKVAEYKQQLASGKARPVSITIPVVVHVVHGGQNVGTFPNISVAQIKSQIKVLNEDFAGQGFNSQNLAATGFSTVGAANTNITFCLAQFDPAGNPLAEPGIDRKNYNTEGWTNPASLGSISGFQALIDGTIKPASIWDPTQYFNIWITDASPSIYLLGYATFPNGSGLSGLSGSFGTGSTDGIWVWTKCFGTTGILQPFYNKGRTAVHETGHWLGLRHIGGDATNATGDCNATDFCDDTPPQKGGNASGANGQNYGSPSYPLHVNVCGSPYGDMFMNFMDYTEDAILYMFTPDQNARMQTAMANGFYRMDLAASSATQCIGLPAIEMINGIEECANVGIKMVYQDMSAGATTYTWSADPPAGVTFGPDNSNADPSISFSFPGTYTVTVQASNSIGNSSSTEVIQIALCDGLKSNSSSLQKVSIAPNPASDLVKIMIPGNVRAEITIYNSLGEQLGSQLGNSTGDTYTLNTENYPDGIYFVSIKSGTGKVVKRLMIVR